MRGAHANIAFELTLSVKQTTARVRTLRRFYLTSATVGDVARRVVLGRAGGGGDLGWRGCVSKRVARNGSVACVAPTRLPTRPNATSRLVVPEPEFAAPPDLPDGRPLQDATGRAQPCLSAASAPRSCLNAVVVTPRGAPTCAAHPRALLAKFTWRAGGRRAHIAWPARVAKTVVHRTGSDWPGTRCHKHGRARCANARSWAAGPANRTGYQGTGMLQGIAVLSHRGRYDALVVPGRVAHGLERQHPAPCRSRAWFPATAEVTSTQTRDFFKISYQNQL